MGLGAREGAPAGAPRSDWGAVEGDEAGNRRMGERKESSAPPPPPSSSSSGGEQGRTGNESCCCCRWAALRDGAVGAEAQAAGGGRARSDVSL